MPKKLNITKLEKKLLHIVLKMAEYLEPNNLNIKLRDSMLQFRLKTKMVNVKANYKSIHCHNLDCDICDEEGKKRKDTQKDTLQCPVIKREISEQTTVKIQILKFHHPGVIF